MWLFEIVVNICFEKCEYLKLLRIFVVNNVIILNNCEKCEYLVLLKKVSIFEIVVNNVNIWIFYHMLSVNIDTKTIIDGSRWHGEPVGVMVSTVPYEQQKI